jgi:hypothetical protein
LSTTLECQSHVQQIESIASTNPGTPLIFNRSYMVNMRRDWDRSTNCKQISPKQEDLGWRSCNSCVLIEPAVNTSAIVPKTLPQKATSDPRWGVPMNMTPKVSRLIEEYRSAFSCAIIRAFFSTIPPRLWQMKIIGLSASWKALLLALILSSNDLA